VPAPNVEHGFVIVDGSYRMIAAPVEGHYFFHVVGDARRAAQKSGLVDGHSIVTAIRLPNGAIYVVPSGYSR
jgi:hypothetical protein